MRFCPFCSAENADELATCAACGRRLPPLPPRRSRTAQPTGVQLPPRTTGSHPPQTASQLGIAPAPVAAPTPAPPPPLSPPPPDDDARRSLLAAITPGPAAHRRESPPEERRDTTEIARRATDVPRAKSQSIPPAIPAAARSKSTTLPPGAPVPPTAFVPPAPRAASPELAPAPLAELIPAPPAAPAAPVLPVESAPVRISPRLGSPALEPPPTRIQRADALADRPFTPPTVAPVPILPDPGLLNAAKYAVQFGRARWQRRGAIKILGAEIKQDTEALDQVLGALGREARNAKLDGRVFSAENAAITAAEQRMADLAKETDEVEARKADENSKFVEIERERNAKLSEAERHVDEAQKELAHLEGQRRGYRDKRKELERRQKAYLKAAEDNDKQSGASQMGETRAELRRAAEMHRKEAALLEPERQDIDRRLAALERPIGEATAKLDAAKAELDAAKRSLADAREGHNHRLAELDAEQKRKARDIGTSEAEIARRLVTLGTLVNLNRVDDPSFAELYLRIDRLRGAITARTTEIEKLTSEREAFDRGTLTRGMATIGGAIVLLIALIVIIAALV